MSQTIEDYLCETEQTWSEFCRDPYPVLSSCRDDEAVYCEKKDGHFLFNYEKVLDILTGKISSKKRIRLRMKKKS